MKRVRLPKENDVESIKKACESIIHLIKSNEEIDLNLWMISMGSILAECHRESGYTHEEYCVEMRKMTNFFTWEAK